MADIFNIAGQIHSTSEEQTAVVASEVKDERTDKKQSVINQEVDGQLNNPTSGLEDRVTALEQGATGSGDTPIETNPSGVVAGSGKVTTANAVRGAIDMATGYFECATGASTVAKVITGASVAGFVLPTIGGSFKVKFAHRNSAANPTLNINATGAKAIYYNGQAAGAGNTWDDNEIVEVFYDGTRYQAYNMEGNSGDGVFDISEYNAVEGVAATYADLAAALGTNGANIPIAKRNGGMSVKYIQTSDNKYVQCRYMGTEVTGTPNPFLNTDNWQGVDAKPIPGSKNLPESGGTFNIVAENGIPVSYERSFVFQSNYSTINLDTPIPSGTVITSFNGHAGNFSYKGVEDSSYVAVTSSNLPYTLVKDAEVVRSNTAGTLRLSLMSKKEYYKMTDVDIVPTEDSVKVMTSGSLFSYLGKQKVLINIRGGVEFTNNSVTFKAGDIYLFYAGNKKIINLAEDQTFNMSSPSCVVYDTINETLVLRDINDLLVTDVYLIARSSVGGWLPNSPLYPLYLKNYTDGIKEEVDDTIDDFMEDVGDKIARPSVTLETGTIQATSSAQKMLILTSESAATKKGTYLINVSNDVGVITAYRVVATRTGGNITILSKEDTQGHIGEDLQYTITDEVLVGFNQLRVIVNMDYVTTDGNINVTIKTIPYDIQEDLSTIHGEISEIQDDVEELKHGVVDLIFPVPSDVYCAIGRDMNFYYENMFGMLVGSGYMFIDSPNVVYDTTAAESGSYDGFCNFDRQLHFKPNTAGDMTLYLNVWNETMGQIGEKSTTLHIIDPSNLSGKTINMLVNGSSSIDMGTFQSEIKKLLEENGATVNMVGRWASGSDAAGVAYNNKVSNRLSENRSGGSSEVYVTKSNSTRTKIVHPTNLTDSFFNYSSELVDGNGNHWMVWGNSPSFVELVLKSGDVSTIPSSGTMTKVTGAGPETLVYDSLISDVPQTTNPFWDDTLNGISFATYCQNWSRPTPNVLVTLWGTNDIGGSAGNIQHGKQWATDGQIATFVARQKTLVDAFTRDCPNGVVIMCPQPTGSIATGKKNSDKNGMLYSKLKATQALMDAFVDYSNVIIVPVLWWFDRYYSYNIYERTLSERMEDFYGNTKLDKVSDDTTHPQARGYYQMADAAFSAIVGWVDANE